MGAVERGQPCREVPGSPRYPLLIRDLAVAEVVFIRVIFDGSKGLDHGYQPACFAVP